MAHYSGNTDVSESMDLENSENTGSFYYVDAYIGTNYQGDLFESYLADNFRIGEV